jgi:hypothetical protein
MQRRAVSRIRSDALLSESPRSVSRTSGRLAHGLPRGINVGHRGEQFELGVEATMLQKSVRNVGSSSTTITVKAYEDREHGKAANGSRVRARAAAYTSGYRVSALACAGKLIEQRYFLLQHVSPHGPARAAQTPHAAAKVTEVSRLAARLVAARAVRRSAKRDLPLARVPPPDLPSHVFGQRPLARYAINSLTKY